jgi:hypothetical protein
MPGSLCCAACNESAAIAPYFKRRLSPRRSAIEEALVPSNWSTVDQARGKNRFGEIFASSEKVPKTYLSILTRAKNLVFGVDETVKSNPPVLDNRDCAKFKTVA